MAVSQSGLSPLVLSLAKLLRNDGDLVLDGSSTLTLTAPTLGQLTRLFEQYLLSRSQQHGFLALPSHPADTASLLQLQFLFDVLQKTVSLKIINPPDTRLQSVVKIFPFKSLKILEIKRIPPHCLEGLRGVYSQLEVFICSKSVSLLEELLSLCGGDLSSALPWLELHTLNFSYNSIICLDQSLSLLNVLKCLDVSHNKIQDCAEFLKPLSELEHLNLGYNCLQRAPLLGLSARAKLLTLILRNNQLETINGVEQLSALQHLDLAYNLLLEHAQLAPLSMLHCLHTLNLEGNPLFYQKTHRTCTVRHMSPKAAHLRFKLDGVKLSSSEISVLPKPGRLIVQSQSLLSVGPERSLEGSSGAGELTDSVSVGEGAAANMRRLRKSKSKVRVRRASISEPSDTDYETKPVPAQKVVLPHQEEIERMSSFREQLGEDWLRYQHHLDQGPPLTTTITTAMDHQNLSNGFCSSSPPCQPSPVQTPPPAPGLETEDPVSPLLPYLGVKMVVGGEEEEEQEEMDTESTLQRQSVEESLEGAKEEVSSRKGSARSEGGREEEEEDNLGVDLCHPLLVGVLSDEEEDEEQRRKQSREVFLRLRRGLLLEVDVHKGQERCRLELDSLTRVDTTEATWTQADSAKLPAVELQFDYISKEKQRRRYVLLDDHPQEALQALTEVLRGVVEQNQLLSLGFGHVRLQCLRCGLDFSHQQDQGSDQEPGARVKRRLRSAVVLREDGEEEEEEERADEEDSTDAAGRSTCPGCSSDRVVQLADHSAPYSSTPVDEPPGPGSDRDEDHLDGTLNSVSDDKEDFPDTSLHVNGTNTDDPTSAFLTALSSFYIGGSQGDQSSPSNTTETGEELAGSYHYTDTEAIAAQVSLCPSGMTSSEDELDLSCEDFDAVDHRLKLFFDVEVFEEEEELHSFLKMSAVKFGEPGEVPSLLVVSNLRIYFLEMISDTHRGQLSDWLVKRDSQPILELSYLEVGLGSQCVHMEFGEGAAAYTLLVRDSARCKSFFGRLTGIVREMAHKSDSKLQSISTTRLSPQHHLWPLVCEDIQDDVEEGQLQFFYILAFVLQEEFWTPLTVLATRETLHLLREDHQWRKSATDPTANGSEEPSSGGVTVLESQPISCVSSIVLWPTDSCRMDIKLYDETVKQEKTWSVRSESSELLQSLVAWVKKQWEDMFGVKLSLQEAS
ncbi:serine/threonine-protein kinase 11-interacting protein [Periophthalmus magnuspinnatus]|uniref:serine/threonine-protein kinase 11-interacting protein n=1 Tax=Periophthalmus magnuspinnatus TaxID=409849 RepID=UPI0024365329|nr:serine/threonine-protein kinase 11-interacting protein [Periophthalmus magnuspinnatus]